MISFFLILSILILFAAVLTYRLIKRENKYFNGPIPTRDERAKAIQFITEFLEQHPTSHLAKSYPYPAQIAAASLRYRALELRRPFMDPIDYEIELDLICQMINIDDIKKPHG